MKKLIGGVVIVAGVVVAGWYGTTNNAKTMQAKITSAAEMATQGTTHPISTSVSGRDILVSGLAASVAERDQILASLDDVTGRRLVRDELIVLESASPFAFDADKNADGASYVGMIATEAERAAMADRIGASADSLGLKAGAPDANWTSVLGQGLDGLDLLEDGSLSVRDREIILSGSALTPDEDAAARAALADLPDGYSADFEITTLDDGTPLRLMIARAEDGVLTSSGKIPSTIEVGDLSDALGADVGMGIDQSVLPPSLTEWADVSALGASALKELRSGQMQMTEDSLRVTGVATPDGKAAAEALLANVPSGFTATSDIAIYDDGAPFSLEMTRTGDVTTASGKFPANVAAADVVGDVPSLNIRNAYIGDDTEGFEASATGGAMALAQLEEGTLSVVGTKIVLTGVARTPAEAEAAMGMLSDLPDGYSADFEITTLDDGTPLRLMIARDEDGVLTSSGKIPSTVEVGDLSDALGADVGMGIDQSVLPPSLTGWADVSALGASALKELRSGQIQMTEDSVRVTGVATPDGKAAAEALLANVPSGFTATSDITIYDDGAPFSLEMTRTGDVTSASGKFPANVAAADVVGDVPSLNIRNAFIEDDTSGFETSATGGAMALAQLEEGTLSVVGTKIVLTGVARTPAEAEAAMGMLSDLPDGYDAGFDITTLDDGAPPNFDITYVAGEAASVEGKLPAGLRVDDIAAALALPSVTGTPVLGYVGDAERAAEQLSSISAWLPQVDMLKFSSNDETVTVDALASAGFDQDVVQAGLAEALGEDASIRVTAPIELPEVVEEPAIEGAEVEEVASTELAAPVVDQMAFNADTCNAESAAALQTDRINFVTGSSQLDAQSERAILAVAAIVLKCLAETDLNVEIGGHTDSQGRESSNLRLSTARAEAVRAALVESGVPAEFIVSKGFGESEPIASNATSDGRAANRRTTITWFEPSN